MKKAYIIPTADVLEMIADAHLLSASIEKEDSGTVDGEDMMSRKRAAGIGKGLWEE